MTKQFVTRRVAERVVDLLEVVEVNEEKRQRALDRPRVIEVREVRVNHLQEVAAIAESGEFVRLGLTMALFGHQSEIARRK